jgi:hypothetical protein
MTREETTFEEPTSQVDRLIYYILSRGQKREVEIAELLSNHRFSKRTIKEDHIRPLPENYDWAQVIEEDHKYYYREDIGPHFRKSTEYADPNKVGKLLDSLEIQLGITPRNSQNLPTTVPDTDVDVETMNKLLELGNSNDRLFTKDEHLNRFFDILERVIEHAEAAYPEEEGFSPVIPSSTYRIFFLIVAERHDKWRDGHEHEEFDNELRRRSRKLVDLLKSAPPEIGTIIQPLLAIIDKERGKDAFQNMIHSKEYNVQELHDFARYCYIQQNETHELIRDLNKWRVMIADDSKKEDINSLLEKIRQANNV